MNTNVNKEYDIELPPLPQIGLNQIQFSPHQNNQFKLQNQNIIREQAIIEEKNQKKKKKKPKVNIKLDQEIMQMITSSLLNLVSQKRAKKDLKYMRLFNYC
ncbi:hypothetical protein M0812_27143 [Anaeramoeba flamelloides]|uniref:Uncharacterized protein n=1 Tax=Anaeramoeba flamelloides TaxID=1746091 RepID=A0AAV7YF19_9EUKA|nr:hypothetical protein M0812_27143 [Anaeramoeba flamelloides]